MAIELPEQLRELADFPGVRIWSEPVGTGQTAWKIAVTDPSLAVLAELMGCRPKEVEAEIARRASQRQPILVGGEKRKEGT